MAREKCTLTIENLAMIGALEAFYDMYSLCMEATDRIVDKVRLEDCYLSLPIALDQIRLQCSVESRRICVPVLNSYLYVFTDDWEGPFDSADGFQYFHLFDVKDEALYHSNKYLHRVVSKISFPMFLKRLQKIVARTLYTEEVQKHPNLPFDQMYNNVSLHIAELAKQKDAQRRIAPEHCVPPTNDPLYLLDHLSAISCFRKKHKVVPKDFIGDLVNRTGQIILPVHYCQDCGIYLAGNRTITSYERLYGKLIIEKCKIRESKGELDRVRTQTRLRMLGYNVIDGSMSDHERQNMLVYLLENDRMSFQEICSTIEQNIALFRCSAPHQTAVGRWQSDLEYLHQWFGKQGQSLGIETAL